MPSRDEVLEFSYIIGNMADEQKIPCIDAIIQYCETTGIELDIAATLISNKLKSRIRDEAMANNQLKKSSKLPL
jgi:hypothetical protein